MTFSEDILEKLLKFAKKNNQIDLLREGGIVTGVSREAIRVAGLCDKVELGYQIVIDCARAQLRAEVIKITQDHILVKPFDDTISPVLGDNVFVSGDLKLAPDLSWCGRVINSFAEPLDGQGDLIQGPRIFPVETYAAPALQRNRVGDFLKTGVKIIDIFTPLCFGQRIGIFAGSGVGKSTLLAMMTQTESFDVVVLSLTGERGREVRDMLEDTLAGQTHKVITVVSTGDESAMMRRLCPVTATTIAESFSAQGLNVLLIVDSVTRYALAAREVAIAAQEPPVARGYPPSVFSQISRLLERAGPSIAGGGSITGIYSVLIDGDDHNDPIADSIRGILDGHIVLERSIAAQGRFPALDISTSISRLAGHCWSEDQYKLVKKIKEMIFRYEETRDLRAMGAYKEGGDPVLDQAVRLVPIIYEALQQDLKSEKVADPYAYLANMLKAGH